MKSWLLSCMHGRGDDRAMRGNAAEVYLDVWPARATTATQVRLRRREADWAVDARDTRGNPIRFCGHGALAAARVALDQGDLAAEPLVFVSAAQRWTGRRATGGAEQISLSFARPPLTACPVPPGAALWLGVEPHAAATSGADDDYLVLEVAGADQVRQAQPDAAAICAATRRALVLTSLAASGPVFRYFAPQYGDTEDTATGSAAVQLGAYWRERAGLDAADYVQLSAGGGRMSVRCHTDTVELSARVEYGAAP